MVAEKFNDDHYTPETEALVDTHPYYHPDYAASIELSHQLVSHMHKATPRNCQTKFESIIVLLKRMKLNFEQSGQGDVRLGLEDDEDCMYALGSCHMDFVQRVQSYILYLWHMLDKHDLLNYSMQELDSAIAATNGAEGVPHSHVRTASDQYDDDNMSHKLSSLKLSMMDIDQFSSSKLNLCDSKSTIARMEAAEKEKD